MRRRYSKRADQFVTAVCLDLETEGFSYEKWGHRQFCKRGDWLVWNHVLQEAYTIDATSFAATYREDSPGVFVKHSPVWAEVAARGGSMVTKEGLSDYQAGDYLVSNTEDGSDTYVIPPGPFKRMYELDP